MDSLGRVRTLTTYHGYLQSYIDTAPRAPSQPAYKYGKSMWRNTPSKRHTGVPAQHLTSSCCYFGPVSTSKEV
jgi:hypothetical protein